MTTYVVPLVTLDSPVVEDYVIFAFALEHLNCIFLVASYSHEISTFFQLYPHRQSIGKRSYHGRGR